MCPCDFGPEVFAVLARVLLHELICHVGAGDTDKADPLSPFAEGFMDWASIHYLTGWAPTICGPYATAAILQARASGESFKAHPGTKAAREGGEDAALRLGIQHRRPAAIAQLAVDLNAARCPREPKNEFVRRVLDGTLDASAPPLSDVIDGQTSAEDLLATL